MTARIHTVTFSGVTGFTEQVKLYVFNCANCGVLFGVDNNFDTERRNDGRDFRCPNGHTLSYNSRDRQEKRRLERENERLSSDLARANTRALQAREEAELEKRKRAAAKGQLTKLRKRIANGVCPCCNRHFPQLHQHIATEHPEYKLPEGVSLDG